MKIRSVLPIALLLIFVFIFTINFFVRDAGSFSIVRTFSFMFSIGTGILSTIYAAHAYGFKSKHGRAFLMIALGMGLILAGNIIFLISVLGKDLAQLPPFADIVYMLGYVFFIWGFVIEIRLYKVDFKAIDLFTKIITLLFIISLGSIVLYLEVLSFYDSSISLIANISATSYGIFDFFLIILVVFILRLSLGFGKGKLFTPWLLILIGIITGMIGDIFYSLFFSQYVQAMWPYTMLNVWWVASYLLVTIGFVKIGGTIKDAQALFSKKQP